MRRISAASVAFLAAATGCASVEVDDQTYACTTDAECGAGWRCGGDGVCVRGEPGGEGGDAGEGGGEGGGLFVRIEGAVSHVGEMFEARIVSAARVLRARAIIQFVDAPDFEFEMPDAIPPTGGPHTIEFFFDHDKDGQFSELPGDHQWVRELEGDDFLFVHVAEFDPLPEFFPIGGDFTLVLQDFDAKFPKKRLDCWVREEVSGRAVGFFRLDPIAADAAAVAEKRELRIPGIIDSGTPYQVFVHVDQDDDGVVDDGSDATWRLEGTATDDGTLNVSLDAAAVQSPIAAEL